MIKKYPLFFRTGFCLKVRPTGIELVSSAPQADTLSIELWARKSKLKFYYHVAKIKLQILLPHCKNQNTNFRYCFAEIKMQFLLLYYCSIFYDLVQKLILYSVENKYHYPPAKQRGDVCNNH